MEPKFGRSILQLSQEQKDQFSKERLTKEVKKEERRYQELEKKSKIAEKIISKSESKLSRLSQKEEEEEKVSLKKIDAKNPNKKIIKEKSNTFFLIIINYLKTIPLSSILQTEDQPEDRIEEEFINLETQSH